MPEQIKNIQYADDYTVITTNEKSIDEAMDTFHLFERASGCNLSEDKTKGIILGTNRKVPATKN